MNVYAVCIPETRVAHTYGEPPEPWVPVGIFAADTAGQAKRDALVTWMHQSSSGVYSDDFTALRARKLGVTLDEKHGEIPGGEGGWWFRWPNGWPQVER